MHENVGGLEDRVRQEAKFEPVLDLAILQAASSAQIRVEIEF